jgi:ABC-type transport system involved in multi-copper enzyme maturation permease subunit
MAALSTLLRVERTRILHRPMTWILAVIIGGLAGMIYFSLAVTLLLPEDTEGGLSPEDTEQIRELVIMPDGFGFGVTMVGGFANIALIILAAGTFGSEFSWGTVRTSLISGVSRERFYAGKVTALLLLALVVSLTSAALAFGGSLTTSFVVDRSLYVDEWLNGAFILDALLIIFRTFIGMAVWVLIAAAIALVTHSLAAGVGISLGLNIAGDFLFSLLSAAGDIGRWVSRLFPNQAVNALYSMNGADPPDYGASDYAWISANLTFYALAAIAVAIFQFRRMDIIAASD